MTRVYRVLLMLYPRAFRDRYRPELERVFSDDYREAQRTRTRFTFWIHIVRDLVVSACRLRIAELRRRSAPSLPQPSKRTAMDTLLQDFRYALRQFVRRPSFAAVAILSLAIGIGGNTLIYGLVDGYVLHPFPYPDPDRLVTIGVTYPKLSSDTSHIEALSPAEWMDIKTSRSFASLAAFDMGNRNISGGDVPERVLTAFLLEDLFPVVGMRPALGRGFTSEELAPNGPPAAIISYRVWQSRFGGDPGILDRPFQVNGRATPIVGVMPPGLLLIGTDLWLRFGADVREFPRNQRQFTLLGRLAPGVSLDSANAELATVAARVDATHRAAFKEYEGWTLKATPWADALMGGMRPAAVLLVAAVVLVLLIACANLTNLFLARSTSRQRELAVRLALGAGRTRLVRHLLTESMLLAILGACGGVLIAYLALRTSGGLLPPQLAGLDLRATLNTRVLLWSIAITVAAGLLVGVIPALHATRTDPNDSLKADGRNSTSRAGGRIRAALVVAEIALSVVLLLGAGLLMRTFLNIQRVDTGFDASGVVTMRLTLPRERYRGEAINDFFDRLSERIAATPGVTSVAAASQFPPAAAFDTQFRLERTTDTGGTIPTSLITFATPALFETLRVPLRSGRTFAATDTLTSPPVVIVNQAFVSKYLRDVDPLGQRLRIGDGTQGPWGTIVGVVSDYRNAGPMRPPQPEMVIPTRQQTVWNQLFLLVRSTRDTAATVSLVREAVRSLDPEQPMYMVRTLEDAFAESSFQQRIAAMLLAIFAGVAMTLAAVGIFGVMSYSVAARTQEIGVRLAIGAEAASVRWLVLRQVLKLAAIGLGIGVATLLLAGRLLDGILYGVRPNDPLTITAVAASLAFVALVAAWIPARRASRVDPIEALRYE